MFQELIIKKRAVIYPVSSKKNLEIVQLILHYSHKLKFYDFFMVVENGYEVKGRKTKLFMKKQN